MMLHDPTAAAALRLAAEGLALHDAPLAPPPYLRTPKGCEAVILSGTGSTYKGRGAQSEASVLCAWGAECWELSAGS